MLSVIMGCMTGIIYGYLFIQNDRQWVNISSFFGGNSGLIYMFCKTLNFFTIPQGKQIYHVIVFLFLMATFTIVTILFLIKRLLKDTENEPLRITLTDIILGNKKVFTDYYQQRKDLVDKHLNIDELERQTNFLDNREKEISIREKSIQETKKSLDKSTLNKVHIDLPINFKFLVNNDFLKELPEYLNHFGDFTKGLYDITVDFLCELPEKAKEHSDKELVKTYLNMINCYFVTAFFGGMDSRSHFRILKDKNFEKICAWSGRTDVSDKSLTSIPLGKGMIYYAGIEKRSLVKSANLHKHYKSENDSKWEDYLTIIFPDEPFLKQGIPQISMGVSVRFSNRYTNLLYFLSFIRIEDVILDRLIEVNKELEIMEILSNG